MCAAHTAASSLCRALPPPCLQEAGDSVTRCFTEITTTGNTRAQALLLKCQSRPFNGESLANLLHQSRCAFVYIQSEPAREVFEVVYSLHLISVRILQYPRGLFSNIPEQVSGCPYKHSRW